MVSRVKRIRVMSDLHLEFGPLDIVPAGEDVLVVAGDIGVYTDGAVWARSYARRHDIPVVIIAGNHEFYRNSERPAYTVESTLAALTAVANSEPLMTFLENDIAIVAGVTFIGCTLWTDFALNNDQPLAMARARQAMNDYNLIFQNEHERLTPRHALARHEFSVGILRERLRHRYPEGPIVVVTHHLPSSRSIAGRYANSEYNAAYASRLDDLVSESGAALWVHGHIHISQDYVIGGTRVVCNPRGYDGYELNPSFNPSLVVEIEP
jgi:DNA repair exonuclease SbcCD nuclease subunit